VKFIFPDSQDFVDPSFDFVTETRSETRVRQRDDLYPHELLEKPPYDGMLVSKAVVDGSVAGSGKYTAAQRLRFLRSGVREFFRLDKPEFRHLVTMGDCGAFAYVREKVPPYTVSEVVDFYDQAGFDLGVAVDHIILGFDSALDQGLPGVDAVPPNWRERQAITLQMATEFKDEHARRKCKFVPMAVAQGWSPGSYAYAVKQLQGMGYDYIALGGLVPLKTHEIVAAVKAVDTVRQSTTRLHLLGVTRLGSLSVFLGHGVVSFDSTAPLQRAFKDAKVNYYADPEPFTAIRVPQVDGNPKLLRAIGAGQVDQDVAIRLERECMTLLKAFDKGRATEDAVLDALASYSELHGESGRVGDYKKTLSAKPWKNCPCTVCQALGIDVVIFRGAERNRRRGFHNLFVFRNQMLELMREAGKVGAKS
jgi:hypothetical protein